MLFKLTSRISLLSLRNQINDVRVAAPRVIFKCDQVYAAISNQNYFARNLSLSLINCDSIDNHDQPKPRPTREYRRLGYSIEDDKLIVKYVKKFGDEIETYKKLETKLDKGYATIWDHYKSQLKTTPTITGRFSEKEDEIILSYTEKNGACKASWVAIAELLGRGSPYSVETRHGYLVSNNVRNRKKWELFEDKEILKTIFKIKEVDPRDVNSLESVLPKDFKVVSQTLERSIASCSKHWAEQLCPILKTHLKKLPLSSEWKKDFMAYVIKNKIKHLKELDRGLVVKNVCPGQTIQSVTFYAKVTKKNYKRNDSYKDLPLDEIMKIQLNEVVFYNCSYVNGKTMEKDLQYKNDIVKLYKSLV